MAISLFQMLNKVKVSFGFHSQLITMLKASITEYLFLVMLVESQGPHKRSTIGYATEEYIPLVES